MGTVLEVRDLVTEIQGRWGAETVRVVDGVSLSVDTGRSWGWWGDPAAASPRTAFSIIQLFPTTALGWRGADPFPGQDLLAVGPERLRAIRGAGIGMVFQTPRATSTR